MRVLVFDTETSGLPPRGFYNKVSLSNVNLWPFIVQFSYVIYDTKTNSIEKLEDMIIKVPPHVKLNGESEKIHGITDESRILLLHAKRHWPRQSHLFYGLSPSKIWKLA